MFTESFAQAWRARYGVDPHAEVAELTGFLRHRSVRRFSQKEVSQDLMSALVASAQSAATSSSLQLWSVVSVEDPERRRQVAELCSPNPHVLSAPWFLCFLADHYRLRKAAERVGEGALGLCYTEFFIMALIDAALAAERLVCAAESIGMGICYIGALRNDAAGVKRLLGLPQGVFPAFGLCLGWPEETSAAEIKPRLPQHAVWHRDRYREDVDVAEYDDRMAAFYERQAMKGEVTWSMRSGRRVDEHHMTGRETLLDWARSQGFLLK